MEWTPSSMGKKGGSKKGASKKRGDSDYYKAIRAKRTKKIMEEYCANFSLQEKITNLLSGQPKEILEEIKAGALHYNLQQPHGGSTSFEVSPKLQQEAATSPC